MDEYQKQLGPLFDKLDQEKEKQKKVYEIRRKEIEKINNEIKEFFNSTLIPEIMECDKFLESRGLGWDVNVSPAENVEPSISYHVYPSRRRIGKGSWIKFSIVNGKVQITKFDMPDSDEIYEKSQITREFVRQELIELIKRTFKD